MSRLYGPSRREIPLPILEIHFPGTTCEVLEVKAYDGIVYRFSSSLFNARDVAA